MWDRIFDVLKDAFLDTLITLPFLFGVYLLIEYIEHKSSDKLGKALRKMGPFGSVGGAAIGAIPQCGFSVAASNLYAGRLISMGTLIAVYISTSDEAIPLMIKDPSFAPQILKLILIKIGIAVAAGIAAVLALHRGDLGVQLLQTLAHGVQRRLGHGLGQKHHRERLAPHPQSSCAFLA